MEKIDKELLLEDLCARLPYHVKCKIWLEDGTTEEGLLDLEHNYGNVLQDAFYYNKIKDIKPYLRSMSSMTEEESKEFLDYIGLDHGTDSIENGYIHIIEVSIIYFDLPYKAIDWLNKNMFDYRGLIPMGLAIEVTEDNNPYKE